MTDKVAAAPSDACSAASLISCLQAHQNIDASIAAKLGNLNLTQKKQFVENMDKWTATLKF